jgi:hypothetical protein
MELYHKSIALSSLLPNTSVFFIVFPYDLYDPAPVSFEVACPFG